MFGGDPGVVGTTVRLNEQPFTVIGVAPASFHGTERFVWPDYWIPIVNNLIGGSDYLQNRDRRAVLVIGRLKPGVTPQQATADLNAIAAQLAKEYPKTDKAVSVRLIRPGLMGDDGEGIRRFLYSVNVLALLLLAAVCVNLASAFARARGGSQPGAGGARGPGLEPAAAGPAAADGGAGDRAHRRGRGVGERARCCWPR